MNIIIAGGGKVGSALVSMLSSEDYDVTVIDSVSAVIEKIVERYDVMAVHGNCASMETLRQAGVMEADLLIASTNLDELNLLCCTTAHGMNPKLHTIARIRNPEYTEQIFEMRDIFGLSMIINPEKQAATEIERLLKYPGFLRREVFVKGSNEIVELRVDGNSKLKDVSLIEMADLLKCKVLVCAVLRDGQAITPGGNFVLREGDRLFVTAPTKDLTTLLKNLGIITRRVRNVMLCGAGRICQYLASALLKSKIAVTIVEKDPLRCQETAAVLPDATVICGDASDMEVLESEGLQSMDALVTLTRLEELNIIISLQAIRSGVPLVVTKLGHITNQGVLDSLKLGGVVCPKDLVVSNILRYVRAMQNQAGAAVSLHHIADGQVEALEFLVDEHAHNCGKPLKEFKLKPNILVVSISHGANTEIANGDSVFQKGDTVVVVDSNSREIIRQFNDIFE